MTVITKKTHKKVEMANRKRHPTEIKNDAIWTGTIQIFTPSEIDVLAVSTLSTAYSETSTNTANSQSESPKKAATASKMANEAP